MGSNADRRTFLALGASAGAAAMLPAAPALGAPACTAQTCALPTTRTPIPWSPPKGAVSAPRRSAWDLTPAEIARLRKAYQLMRNLPPSDGRSLQGQRNLHAYYCTTCADAHPPGPGNPTGDIHFSWRFLPWHRMYLYFHERILGSLVGDMSLRLPYWDWEVAGHDSPPPAYAQPRQPLYDATRFLKLGHSVQRRLTNFASQPPGAKRYYQLSLVQHLFDCPFEQFGGTDRPDPNGAPKGGVVEAGSHGYVHVSAGGDNTRYDHIPCSGNLAILNTAGLDPIFYAHHANLDRLWHSWETYGSNQNPDAPAWKDLAWSFFDADGTWCTMRAGDIAPMEHVLSYGYEKKIAPAMTVTSTPRPVTLQKNGRDVPHALANVAPASVKSAEVRLTGLQVPGAGDFTITVNAGGVAHPISDSSFFIVSHGGGMTMDAQFNVCVPVFGDYVSVLVQALKQNGRFYIAAPRTRGSRLFAAAGPGGTPVRADQVQVILR